MFNKFFLSVLLFTSIVLLSSGQIYAQEKEGEIIIISERVGKEIDSEEREKFKLFEGIKGFQSAVYIKLPDGRYFLKITYLDEKTGEIKISRVLQSEASIKNRGDYIDRFEEIQAAKHQYQNLSKPQTVSSDSGEIQTHQDAVYQGPGTAFYIEFGGKGVLSLNVDYRRDKSDAMGFGIQQLKDITITSFMYYRFRGETYRTEIGGGLSGVFDEGFVAVLFHGVYGYRYQKKNGLLFRIGFTPIIGIRFKGDRQGIGIIPLVGISVGYSL